MNHHRGAAAPDIMKKYCKVLLIAVRAVLRLAWLNRADCHLILLADSVLGGKRESSG